MADSAKLSNVEKLPDAPNYESHIWADYLELLCLVNPDHEFSKADALDRFRERVDDLGEVEDELWTDGEEISAPEINDKWTRRVDDWFRHLEFRAAAFGDSYPFSFPSGRDTLKVSYPLTLMQKFYTYFLLSSCLGKIRNGKSLTSDFETLSREALRKLLGAQAEVHVFGTSGTRYRGNKWTKITQLASDLREIVGISNEFASTDTGDLGLDVVAWVPFSDTAPGLLVVFGQCGCTPNWVEKRLSSSALAWERTIPLTCSSSNAVFIPYCYRNTEGGWHQRSNVHGSLLIDRLRFMGLLKDNLEHFQSQRSLGIVEEILRQPEDVF